MEKRIQKITGWIFRGGILLAVFLISSGFLLHFARHGELALQGTLTSHNVFFSILRNVRALQTGISGVPSIDLIQLGLFMVLLTPYLCLTILLLIFLWKRNLLYVLITLFILSTLGYRLF